MEKKTCKSKCVHSDGNADFNPSEESDRTFPESFGKAEEGRVLPHKCYCESLEVQAHEKRSGGGRGSHQDERTREWEADYRRVVKAVTQSSSVNRSGTFGAKGAKMEA